MSLIQPLKLSNAPCCLLEFYNNKQKNDCYISQYRLHFNNIRLKPSCAQFKNKILIKLISKAGQSDQPIYFIFTKGEISNLKIKVFRVSNSRELNIFSKVPDLIYDNPPYNTKNYAQFNKLMQNHYRNTMLFVAVVNNYVVGRIAAMLNPNSKFKNAVLFGYFESINDKSVSTELFNKVTLWAKQKEQEYMIGPVSYNTNDSVGLLVEGFNEPQQRSMPYNPSYYIDLIEGFGLEKYFDLLAYSQDTKKPISDKLVTIAKRAEKTDGLIVRQINLSQIEKEAMLLSKIHNKTMLENSGHEFLSASDAAKYLYS